MSEIMETQTTEPTTRSAIATLKDRGKRIRDKGIGLLSGAGIAAISCAIAFTVYLNTDAASSFSSIDLPAVEKSVIEPLPSSSPSALRSVGESPFQSPANAVIDMMNSTLWKTLGIIGILILGVMFAFGGSVNIGGILSVVAMAFVLPYIARSLLSGEPSTKEIPQAAGSFIKQLIEEKRYAELAEASGAMMPKGQAAYVKAQIAYLSEKKEAAQAELGQLNASSLAGWSPDWGRISTMEKFAFGSQQLPQSRQYAAEINQKAESTYSTVTMLAGATMILAVPGIALFGFGSSMRKRASRLESMLGVPEDQSKVLLTTSEPVTLPTPQPSEWVPAWRRPVAAKSASNNGSDAGSVAMGAATAAVVLSSMESSNSACDSASGSVDGGCV